MKKIFLITLFTFAVNLLNAQSIENLGDFSELIVEGTSKLYLKQDETNSLSIENSSKTINDMYKLDGNKLIIKPGSSNIGKEEKLVLKFKNLEKITCTGQTDLIGEGILKTNEIEIISSGSSDIVLNIEATNIVANVSGSGDLKLIGNAKLLKANISGAGDLKGGSLKVEKAEINSSGAGDASIEVSQSLTGSASGAGSITYKGNPSEIIIEQSGVGSVKRADSWKDLDISVQSKEESDTTKIKIGNKRIIILGEKEKGVESNEYPDPERKNKSKKKKVTEYKVKNIYNGIDFGFNSYVGANNSFSLPSQYKGFELDYRKSFTASFNLIERHLKLYKEYIALTTGLGFEFNRFEFQNRYSLLNVPDTVIAVSSPFGFKKNSLRSRYLNVPLFIEFNTNKNPNRSFHFAPGIIAGYRLGSARLYQEYSINEVQYEQTTYGNFYVSPFKVSAAVRFGYGKLNFFATYSLNELFAKNKAPNLYPVTFGINLFAFD